MKREATVHDVIKAAVDMFNGNEKEAGDWLVERCEGLGNIAPLANALNYPQETLEFISELTKGPA